MSEAPRSWTQWGAVLYDRPFSISTRQRMDMYSYIMVNEGNEQHLLECRLCSHITKSMKWKQIPPVESSNGTWIEQGSVKTRLGHQVVSFPYMLTSCSHDSVCTCFIRVISDLRLTWLVNSSVRHLVDVSHLSLESWLLSRSRLMTPSLQGVCSPWPVRYRHDSQWDNIHLWPL